MVNVCAAPVHPLADGVTVIVAVIGAPVAFVAVNDPILPVPDAARPMAGLEFVQLYAVPVTAPVKFTAAVAAPLQRV